ncbi:hypothetical protein C2759_03690 [Polynucleobacter sp. MG-Unter2-18]|uniref:hypothetical protein n=1 Tax=Polynucleobacter sp. MG-Unter2-18 TaxID=2081052 RepID=UPI001BFE5EB9|nr:hypothetical protein [Polynucleobacter sp. MG-Unter2-18]QWD95241.1 hypothetical protein C2759_03690 [Polynucleobacter sp. MG-Unter2-18]
MNKKTEKDLLEHRHKELILHVKSAASSLKIKNVIFSAIADENIRDKQIDKIRKRLDSDLSPLSREELLDEIAKLTWGCEFLFDIAKIQEKKLDFNRKSANELALKEEQYKSKVSANRRQGAKKANQRHETSWKIMAKNKWVEISEKNSRSCGHLKLMNALIESYPDHDWKLDTLKGWVKSWRG